MDRMNATYLTRVLNPFRKLPLVPVTLPTPAPFSLRWMMRMALNLFLPMGLVVLAFMKVESLDRTPVICPYRLLFGTRCPGCGLTHAFCAVLHGHFAAAFGYNPLVIVAFPFFFIFALRDLACAVRDLRTTVRLHGSEALPESTSKV